MTLLKNPQYVKLYGSVAYGESWSDIKIWFILKFSGVLKITVKKLRQLTIA